jgi:adenosylcobinamide kinase/adenosylcobinamide-phosphate guanylyltransferase
LMSLKQGEREILKKKLILVTGGARSGKSTFAVNMAKAAGDKVTYIATAKVSDPEMSERINKHRNSRPKDWQTIEAENGIVPAIEQANKNSDLIILDCLGAFVSSLLEREEISADIISPQIEERVEEGIGELIQILEEVKCEVIVVSNEVGQGLVPAYPLGRSFRDLLGLANQAMAERADEVYWMVAGIPVNIKKSEDR